jgi:hypothetical protein
MSTAAELIKRCRAAGLSLAVEGDALHVDFERDPPAELIQEIRQHKPKVIVALSEGGGLGNTRRSSIGARSALPRNPLRWHGTRCKTAGTDCTASGR